MSSDLVAWDWVIQIQAILSGASPSNVLNLTLEVKKMYVIIKFIFDNNISASLSAVGQNT